MEEEWIADYSVLPDIAYSIAEGENPTDCPICNCAKLRFYWHAIETTPGVRRSCSVWVWCPVCRHWGVGGNMRLQDGWEYNDPYAGNSEEVGRMEEETLVKYLNPMWEEGKLQTTVIKH